MARAEGIDIEENRPASVRRPRAFANTAAESESRIPTFAVAGPAASFIFSVIAFAGMMLTANRYGLILVRPFSFSSAPGNLLAGNLQSVSWLSA